jgi:hypothetical protein
MKHFAIWRAHGENCYMEADSLEALHVMVFGSAYAPSKSDVRFYQRDT